MPSRGSPFKFQNPRGRREALFFDFKALAAVAKPSFSIFKPSRPSRSPPFRFSSPRGHREALLFDFQVLVAVAKLSFSIFKPSRPSRSSSFRFSSLPNHLERIADSQMQTKSVFKLRNVVITFLSSIVRNMQTNTTINNNKIKIITNTNASSQGQIFDEASPFQLCARTVRIFMDQPNITGIQESSSV